MNEHLKAMLATMRMNWNLRMRLEKIFAREEAVIDIILLGTECGRKLEVSKEDLPALLRICEAIPALQKLIILGSHLDDASMALIAEVVPKLLQLRTLYIEGDEIHEAGFCQIGRCVQRHPTLEIIFLHGDNLNDKVVADLTQVIFANPNIQQISVRGKQISEVGIQCLAQLISSNRLEQIAIICDRLSVESCKLLGKLIAENGKLSGLALDADIIDGLDFILDAIKINSVLTSVAIFDNSLVPAEAFRVEQLMSQVAERQKLKIEEGAKPEQARVAMP